MKKVANVLIAIVAIEHLLFLVLEMFLWTSPTGMRIFGTTPDFATQSAALAANQGLYNGFLAAGLIWSLLRKDDADALKIFFLACVVIAGVFGGLTAKASILFVQGMPPLAALLLVIFNRRKAT
ncbi:MAG: DUF1304 domain-containing protein [Woeseiaceae bacterium]